MEARTLDCQEDCGMLFARPGPYTPEAGEADAREEDDPEVA